MYLNKLIYITLLVFLAFINNAGTVLLSAEKGVVIEVDAAVEEGVISPIFSPSVFASWSSKDAKNTFLRDARCVGLGRLSVESYMTSSISMDDYIQKLQKAGAEWGLIEKKQGKIILTLARMPYWLSSNQSREKLGPHDFLAYEASPPKSYEQWSQLVYETVKHFNLDLGLDVYYELWNEPDSKGFWLGTEEEFLKLYKYFVLGARSAVPDAKVGGPTVSNPRGVIGNPSRESMPLIYSFIEYASSESIPELGLSCLPIDFLVWHQFNSDPHNGWTKPANQIRETLKQFHYNQTALIVDEWALWSTKAWEDPLRDTQYAAAYAAATLFGVDKAGIHLQSIAALQDFEYQKGHVFHGDFGLLTKGEMGQVIKKSAYNALMIYNSTEGGIRIKTIVCNPLLISLIPTVEAITTKHPDRMTIIIWNYISPPREYFIASLEALGYTLETLKRMIKKKKPNITYKDISRFVEDEKTIDDLAISEEVKKDIKNARAVAMKSQGLAIKPVSIQIRLSNSPFYSMKYERFTIDSSHSNSFYYYQTAKKQGKDEKDAIKSAMEHQELEKVEENILNSIDTIPPIVMEPYSVHLITLTKL